MLRTKLSTAQVLVLRFPRITRSRVLDDVALALHHRHIMALAELLVEAVTKGGYTLADANHLPLVGATLTVFTAGEHGFAFDGTDDGNSAGVLGEGLPLLVLQLDKASIRQCRVDMCGVVAVGLGQDDRARVHLLNEGHQLWKPANKALGNAVGEPARRLIEGLVVVLRREELMQGLVGDDTNRNLHLRVSCRMRLRKQNLNERYDCIIA